jgi:hypothetical protein
VQQERSAQLESDVSPYEQRFSRIVASIMVVLALAIATGLSAWVGQQRHSSNSGQQVAFKVIDAAQRDLQPSEALSALKNAAEQRVFYTNRSTSDFWVLIDTTQAGSHQSREFVVELSSKHGTKTECWPLASGASQNSSQPVATPRRFQLAGQKRDTLLSSGQQINRPATSYAVRISLDLHALQ